MTQTNTSTAYQSSFHTAFRISSYTILNIEPKIKPTIGAINAKAIISVVSISLPFLFGGRSGIQTRKGWSMDVPYGMSLGPSFQHAINCVPAMITYYGSYSLCRLRGVDPIAILASISISPVITACNDSRLIMVAGVGIEPTPGVFHTPVHLLHHPALLEKYTGQPLATHPIMLELSSSRPKPCPLCVLLLQVRRAPEGWYLHATCFNVPDTGDDDHIKEVRRIRGEKIHYYPTAN